MERNQAKGTENIETRTQDPRSCVFQNLSKTHWRKGIDYFTLNLTL